jgi:hypothetical protein
VLLGDLAEDGGEALLLLSLATAEHAAESFALLLALLEL